MPLLCHCVLGMSLVAMQSYAEPGKPRADCKASPSHSPSIRDFRSSFLCAGAGEGTCLCNQDTNKCRLQWVEVWKYTAEWGAFVESALPAASVLLCQRSCRMNISFWQNRGSKGKQHIRNFLDAFQGFTYPHFAQEQVYWEKHGWRGDVKQVALPVELTGDALMVRMPWGENPSSSQLSWRLPLHHPENSIPYLIAACKVA